MSDNQHNFAHSWNHSFYYHYLQQHAAMSYFFQKLHSNIQYGAPFYDLYNPGYACHPVDYCCSCSSSCSCCSSESYSKSSSSEYEETESEEGYDEQQYEDKNYNEGFDRGSSAGFGGPSRGRFNDGSRGHGVQNFRGDFSDRDSERSCGYTWCPRPAAVNGHRPSSEFKDSSTGFDRGSSAGFGGPSRGRFNDGSRGHGVQNFRGNFSDRDFETSHGSTGYPGPAVVKGRQPTSEFKEPSTGFDRGALAAAGGPGRRRFNDGSRGRGVRNFKGNFSDRDSESCRGSTRYPRPAAVKGRRPSPELKEPSSDESECEYEFNVDAILQMRAVKEELRKQELLESKEKEGSSELEDGESSENKDANILDGKLYKNVEGFHKSKEEENRKVIMEYIYGSASDNIVGLQTSMELDFEKYCDDYQPSSWPVLPLRL